VGIVISSYVFVDLLFDCHRGVVIVIACC